jgi:hypothetical protein
MAWIKGAIQLAGIFLLWIVCVTKLCKDFAQMPLDQRLLFGLGAYLLLVGLLHQTPKVLANWRARNA